MPLPQNAQAIYSFLVGQGLSPNAAAGIAGNIEQESGGNPRISSPAGGGLFGLTLANGGSVNGGSLSQELNLLIQYIHKNGSIQDVNAHASSPSAAALYFSQRYERPGIPNNANRMQSANDVAAAAKSGNWKGSDQLAAGANPPPSGGGGGILGLDQITPFFTDALKLVTGGATKAPWGGLLWLVSPANWVRIAAFLVGLALLLIAVHALLAVGEGQPIIPKIQPVPVPV